MTTADYLESLQSDLSRTIEALDLEEGTNFTDIAQMAEDGDISTGGGGADLSDYFNDTISESLNTAPAGTKLIKKIPNNITVTSSSLAYAFRYFGITEAPALNTSSVTDMRYMFSNCASLTTVPQYNTTNVTQITRMFENCTSLTTIPLLDFSNVTTGTNVFDGCSALVNVPALDVGKLANLSWFFRLCSSLVECPQLDTSSATNFQMFFQDCSSLTTVPVLDTSKATNLNGFVYGCTSLSNDSLNNILKMCINATSYNGTKTLYYLFGNNNYSSYYPASTIQSLSNYSSFTSAGWSIGW